MFDPKKSEEIGKQAKEWNEKIEKTLAKNPERKNYEKITSCKGMG